MVCVNLEAGLTVAIMSGMVDGLTILERMERAVEKVRERLLRVTSIIEHAKAPYADAGGNAVAAWVATVDEGAVRTPRDVDVLVRETDLARLREVLEPEGFVYRHFAGINMVLDGGVVSPHGTVRLGFARLVTRDGFELPDVDQSVDFGNFRVLSLEALVRSKLIANRRKDQVHLMDMIGVGLVDQTWPGRFEPELGRRLQTLLDDPKG